MLSPISPNFETLLMEAYLEIYLFIFRGDTFKQVE
jgi:hypothetical protein